MNFGIIGLVLIAVSWLPELKKTLMEKKIRDLDIKFVTLYFLGSVFLLIHAIVIHDMVFIVLNSLLAMLAFLEIIIIKVKE